MAKRNLARAPQSLAGANAHLRPLIESVLVEVLTGVNRARAMKEVYSISFKPETDYGLVATVRTEDGGHSGAWAITLRAL